MALAFSLVASDSNNADQSSYNIPPVSNYTPVSGALYYIFLHISKASTPDSPTVTGTGGWNVTWTQEGTVTYNTLASPNRRLSLFSAVASSSDVGVITAQFGAGNTQTSIGWSLIKVTGNAASGYSVQVKTTTIDSVGQALTLTFDNAFSNSGNEHLGALGQASDQAATPGTGFAELSDITWTGPNTALEVNNLINDTSCDWTWTGSIRAGAISVEVAVAGATDYPLNAAAGSYAITGAAATPLADRLLSLVAGSYSVTGSNATLLADRFINAASSSYLISGANATILADRLIAALAGSYTLTGIDATLLADRLLAILAGSYTITGVDATLLAERLVNAEPGLYSITGANSTLLADRSFEALPGVYLLTGSDAILVVSGAAVGQNIYRAFHIKVKDR